NGLTRFGYFAFALLTSSLVCAQPSIPVILISVDTLRADRLGCYQSERRLTPHIDAFAKDGTLFSAVTSLVPLTLPSHAALRNSSAPIFLFLHLYDLHTPYALPESVRLRSGETGYNAELAYVDRVLGEFFTFLNANELLKRSLVVFTSDHGEGLGDHHESTHG